MALPSLASVPPPSPIEAGMVLDRYELVCKLADGGMAAVWIARQQGKHGFEKLVAVKTILPTLTHDPSLVQDEDPLRNMFLDEARIAARVDHPNVARILDLGEEAKVLYLVMEWVEGEPLAKLHRLAAKAKVEFPVGVYLRIVADACAGLHAAHEIRDDDGSPLDVVHRDVSPQNIIVNMEGHAKIIDFGVVRARGRVSDATTFGMLKGKIQYMPPEQARGEPVDRTADVWAIGAMLYQFFVGRPVYAGETEVEVMTKLISREPIDPLPEKVPEGIRTAITRALALKQADRFATAADLRAALLEAMTKSGLNATTADAAKFVEEMAGARVAGRRERVREAIRALKEDGAVAAAFHSPEVSSPARPADTSHARRVTLAVTTAPAAESPSPRSKLPLFVGLGLLALVIGTVAWVKTKRPSHEIATAPTQSQEPGSVAPASSPAVIPTVDTPTTAPPSATTARAVPIVTGGKATPRGVPTISVATAVTATPTVSEAPVVAPAETPTPAPPPPPVAAPVPAPAPPPVAAPTPTVDPSRAHVRITGVQNERGVPKRAVQSALARSIGPMTECYRTELARTTSGPTGPGTLRIETDEAGRITRSKAAVNFSPTVARCIERAVSGVRVTEVDTGEAVADVLLTFELQ